MFIDKLLQCNMVMLTVRVDDISDIFTEDKYNPIYINDLSKIFYEFSSLENLEIFRDTWNRIRRNKYVICGNEPIR